MKDASLDSQKKEAVHKARIVDWEIYDVAKNEANRFIVGIVANVWISPLSKGRPTFYAKRISKELLDQIQVVCPGKIRTMHVTTDTTPQYIAALEKVQLQAARAEMPIPDNYLMMVDTEAMLSS